MVNESQQSAAQERREMREFFLTWVSCADPSVREENGRSLLLTQAGNGVGNTGCAPCRSPAAVGGCGDPCSGWVLPSCCTDRTQNVGPGSLMSELNRTFASKMPFRRKREFQDPFPVFSQSPAVSLNAISLSFRWFLMVSSQKD